MILITGSNGFLASELVEKIKDRELSLLGRSDSSKYKDFTYFNVEVGGTSDYSVALNQCKILVHCAARVHLMDDKVENPLEAYRDVNTKGTINLAKQAIGAGVKRFIFISSIKVNGESSIEGAPFRFFDSHSPQDYYALSKSEAELQLQLLAKDSGMEVVIIRPTLVYGPGVKANFASLMNLVSKGIPLPFGCITNNKRSLVSVNNLVDLIVTCIDHPKAANQVFLASDDHDVSTSQMVRQMAKSLGKSELQLPIPQWCYKLVGKVFGKQDVVDRLLGSLQVDISHTKETLGWKPPQSLEDGFNETAEAFLLNKENNK